MLQRIFLTLFFMITGLPLGAQSLKTAAPDCVRVRNGQLIRHGRPYYFVGTNLWYAPILASTGQGGDRERLDAELDHLKRLGVDNLRILCGADAGSDSVQSVVPYLQSNQGVLNDTLLDGLDYLLAELERRDMTCVIYLTNAWDWSGGYGYYLRACGYGHSPLAEGEGYNRYVRYASDFSRCREAQELFFSHIRRIVGRTNRYTQLPYSQSPAIMAWQVCNEPRPFASDTKENFAAWVTEAAHIIKQTDRNHLVSTGSEGLYGCEKDADLCERIHNHPDIDYLTVHIWPVNWGWASRGNLYRDLPNVLLRTGEYLDLHERMAHKMGKPLVIEEFGYPRDLNSFSPEARTDSRDAFYAYIFRHIMESKQTEGVIAGCNFWGWGGTGRPAGRKWHPGKDYLCDPPHEPQGWYSVFDTDTTTLRGILSATTELRSNP